MLLTSCFHLPLEEFNFSTVLANEGSSWIPWLPWQPNGTQRSQHWYCGLDTVIDVSWMEHIKSRSPALSREYTRQFSGLHKSKDFFISQSEFFHDSDIQLVVTFQSSQALVIRVTGNKRNDIENQIIRGIWKKQEKREKEIRCKVKKGKNRKIEIKCNL